MPNEPHKFSRLAEELIGDFRQIPDETPSRMRKRPTLDLAGLVEDILVKNQIGREGPEDTVRKAWPDIVGSANAHYTHVGLIDAKGKLTILTNHSVVRNELFHHRKGILEKVRALPGCAGDPGPVVQEWINAYVAGLWSCKLRLHPRLGVDRFVKFLFETRSSRS